MNLQLQWMEIINLTPDSFSDGGLYFTLKNVKKKVEKILTNPLTILDFGAESTAPCNRSIDQSTEKQRFIKLLIPLVREGFFVNRTISIDTYRLETFSDLYHLIKSLSPTTTIMWNDVSGVIDTDSLYLLKEDCSEALYICCHQYNEQRSMTAEHMNRIKQQELLPNMIHYFTRAVEKYSIENLMDRVYFDPGFGFSKSLEQNKELLKNLDQLLMGAFSDISWVVGISRKSFLRQMVNAANPSLDGLEEINAACDVMAFSYYEQWRSFFNEKRSLIIRGHITS